MKPKFGLWGWLYLLAMCIYLGIAGAMVWFGHSMISALIFGFWAGWFAFGFVNSVTDYVRRYRAWKYRDTAYSVFL